MNPYVLRVNAPVHVRQVERGEIHFYSMNLVLISLLPGLKSIIWLMPQVSHEEKLALDLCFYEIFDLPCNSIFGEFLKFMQGDSCSIHPFSQSFPPTEPYPQLSWPLTPYSIAKRTGEKGEKTLIATTTINEQQRII
jgi:hypothetical protein